MRKRAFIVIYGLLLVCLACGILTACTGGGVGSTANDKEDAQAPDTADGGLPEENTPLSCTLSIRCDTILLHMEDLAPGKADLVPEDGILLELEDLPFEEGDSVFDVLKRELQARRMHMEFSGSVTDTVYVEGLGNLYEYDCGDLSGWVYKVNGERIGYSCSQYILEQGDMIEWLYTCDLGNDV